MQNRRQRGQRKLSGACTWPVPVPEHRLVSCRQGAPTLSDPMIGKPLAARVSSSKASKASLALFLRRAASLRAVWDDAGYLGSSKWLSTGTRLVAARRASGLHGSLHGPVFDFRLPSFSARCPSQK